MKTKMFALKIGALLSSLTLLLLLIPGCPQYPETTGSMAPVEVQNG